MGEGQQRQPDRAGGENPGVDADVAGEGDEGRRAAAASPAIGEDAVPGQTTSPPEPGEVGVPSDEELGREEEQAE
jgi:hypothetical protein